MYIYIYIYIVFFKKCIKKEFQKQSEGSKPLTISTKLKFKNIVLKKKINRRELEVVTDRIELRLQLHDWVAGIHSDATLVVVVARDPDVPILSVPSPPAGWKQSTKMCVMRKLKFCFCSYKKL